MLLTFSFRVHRTEICISAAFWVVAAVMLGLHMAAHFTVLFLVITIHELTHVMTARLYALHTRRITVLPIGQAAQIGGLSGVSPLKRANIILAGPLANVLMAVVCRVIFGLKYPFFIQANMLAALWNLLPAAPLDGGRLLNTVLSRFVGAVPSIKICKTISRIIAVFLIGAGLIQAVLYPYNISLVLAAVYLYKLSDKESEVSVFEHYMAFAVKYSRILPVKTVMISSETPIRHVFELLCCDVYYIFHIADCRGMLTESELYGYVCQNGANGFIYEIGMENQPCA